MINKSEQINELVKALCVAQSELEPAIKDSINPFYKSNYADLSSVWSVCRKVLSKNNLAVIQTIDTKENILSVITMLAHSSGQWITGNISSSIEKLNPQQIGSMISYFRRYGLASMVGVVQEDDDGEATKGIIKNDSRETKTGAISKPPNQSNGTTGPVKPEQTVKSNGAELPTGTKPAHQNPNSELTKLSQTKFTSGVYTDKTFEQVLTLELKSDHKWAKQRIKEIKEGKTIPELAVRYLDYAKQLGAPL